VDINAAGAPGLPDPPDASDFSVVPRVSRKSRRNFYIGVGAIIVVFILTLHLTGIITADTYSTIGQYFSTEKWMKMIFPDKGKKVEVPSISSSKKPVSDNKTKNASASIEKKRLTDSKGNHLKKINSLSSSRKKDEYIISQLRKDRNMDGAVSRELIEISKRYKSRDPDIMFLQMKTDAPVTLLRENSDILKKLMRTNKIKLKLFSKFELSSGLGDLLSSRGKHLNALKWYRISLKYAKNADRGITYKKIGDIYFLKSKYRNALSSYKRAKKYIKDSDIQKKIDVSRKKQKQHRTGSGRKKSSGRRRR